MSVSRSGVVYLGISIYVLLAMCAACIPQDNPRDVEVIDDDDPACQHDSLDSPEAAGELAPVAEGYLCPMGDRDWYRISVPDEHGIVDVSLSAGTGSPVQPTYSIYECDELCLADPPDDSSERCCTSVAIPRPSEVQEGHSLEVTHCLQPGAYYILVHDQGDDQQDGRQPRGLYQLSVATRPNLDLAEPNDGPDNPTAPESTGLGVMEVEGRISCRDDQDWYLLDDSTGMPLSPTRVVHVHLEVPVAGYHPQVRLVGPDDSSQEMWSSSNPAASVVDTEIEEFLIIPSRGRYWVVVEDDDGMDSDGEVAYDLTVELIEEGCSDEPNNAPDIATHLDTMDCTSEWTVRQAEGSIDAINDVDYFRVPLSGCQGGILEASLELGGERRDELQPSLRIIRADPETTCSEDADCRRLTHVCDPSLGGLDCSGLGSTCLPEGFCAGASVCLPGGLCGANIIERHPDFCGVDRTCHGPSGPAINRPCTTDEECAPQDRIATAIPLGRGPDPTEIVSLDHVYVVVQDFRADQWSGMEPYTLRLRTRDDPDDFEPNELYYPLQVVDGPSVDVGLGQELQWTECAEGTLSYERNRDFFTLPHPCPDSPNGCMLRVDSTLGSGPVEVLANMGPYIDLTRLNSSDDRENWDPRVGLAGGEQECLPANSSMSDSLTLMVRDLEPNRDFSADQSYRICFSIENTDCVDPCVVVDGECFYE